MSGKKVAAVLIPLAAIVVFLCWYFMRLCLFVDTAEGHLAVIPINDAYEFSFRTRFIHSVQKTPVEEFFRVDADTREIILTSTRYQSFGVGLPFLMSDGSFSRDGDFLVMSDMNRRMPELDLRPGVSTQLPLYVGEEFPLYELVPLGSLVRVHVGKFYERFDF